MATAAELIVEEELKDLEEVAAARNWSFERGEISTQFVLGIPAKDGVMIWLLVNCAEYKVLPPAWHWFDYVKKESDTPGATPSGTGFIHSAGIICAPWNRLAYKRIDGRGPHDDWTIGDWTKNPHTGACTTLTAMAIRIDTELQSDRYHGIARKAA